MGVKSEVLIIKQFLAPTDADGRCGFIIKKTVLGFRQHELMQVSGQLAYFITLSIFPFLIFLNALIASFNLSYGIVLDFLEPLFPAQISNLIASYIESISQTQSVSLISVGIIVIIFSASKSVRALERAINRAYEIEERRGLLRYIFFSMVFIVIIALIIVVCVLFTTLSRGFLLGINASSFLANTISVWRWLSIALVFFVVITLIYRTLPRKKIKLRQAMPGAILALVGFLFLTIAFSIYVDFFANSSIIYGSIGAVVMLLLWVYFASMIIILGAELNHAFEELPAHMARRREGS